MISLSARSVVAINVHCLERLCLIWGLFLALLTPSGGPPPLGRAAVPAFMTSHPRGVGLGMNVPHSDNLAGLTQAPESRVCYLHI